MACPEEREGVNRGLFTFCASLTLAGMKRVLDMTGIQNQLTIMMALHVSA